MAFTLASLINIRGHTLTADGLNAGSVAIDAGAHRGEFSWLLASRFGCRCILLEPHPTLARQILLGEESNLVRAALGSANGTSDFYLRENLESGGIIRYASDIHTESCHVDVVSLKTLMRDYSIEQLDLLKLDIEGAEFSLLLDTDGAVLSRIRQISVEFHDFLPAFKRRGLYREVCRRMRKLDFVKIVLTFRSHGDVLFLNRRCFPELGLTSVAAAFLARFYTRVPPVTWPAGVPIADPPRTSLAPE